jgi:hypothetical protein
VLSFVQTVIQLTQFFECLVTDFHDLFIRNILRPDSRKGQVGCRLYHPCHVHRLVSLSAHDVLLAFGVSLSRIASMSFAASTTFFSGPFSSSLLRHGKSFGCCIPWAAVWLAHWPVSSSSVAPQRSGISFKKVSSASRSAVA